MKAEARAHNVETEVHLTDVLLKIEQLLGLRYQPHQWSDLLRLLKPAARELGYADSSIFLQWLLSSDLSEQDIRILAKHLTIGESYFFREIVVFSILREKVLPALLESKKAHGNRHVRIWSAGCSTGEEVYTLAILLDSFFSDKPDWKFSILGTDINPVSIERAREGRYRDWSFRDVPSEIHSAYFEKLDDGRHEVVSRIKEQTEFRMLNLVSTPSLYPAGFDMIFCRNVLMYFTKEKVKSIVQGFRRSVTEGGWLIPSLTETTLINNPGFEGVRFGEATLFRKQAPIPKILTFRHQPKQPVKDTDTEPAPANRGLRNPFNGLLPSRDRGSGSGLEQVEEIAASAESPERSAFTEPDTSAVAAASDQIAQVHARIQEARQHADAGRLEQAMEAIDAAIALDKMAAASHYLRGTILLESGETTKALQAFERALYLNQDFIPAHYSIGTLHHMLGNGEKARRHFGIAVQLIDALGNGDALLEPGDVSAGEMLKSIRTIIDEQ